MPGRRGGLMLYEHKDESILDQYDADLAKLKYDYLVGKIDEATQLVEKQIVLLRRNDKLMADLAEALEIIKAKRLSAK